MGDRAAVMSVGKSSRRSIAKVPSPATETRSPLDRQRSGYCPSYDVAAASGSTS